MDDKELFWDDLPYQYELQCFNSKEGTIQVRMLVRGIDRKAVDVVGRALQRLAADYIRKLPCSRCGDIPCCCAKEKQLPFVKLP